MTKKHIYETRVYYADTDAYGVVWHGTYLRWMEAGRIEFTDKILGLDLKKMQEEGCVLPVVDINIKYNLEQKLLLGKVNAVCGNVLFVSDNAGDFSEKTMGYLKNFFKKKDYKIHMAEYVSRDVISLDFSEDGVQKCLKFNIKTGKSNIRDDIL